MVVAILSALFVKVIPLFHLSFLCRWTLRDWCVTQSKGHLETHKVLFFKSMRNDLLLLLKALVSVSQVVQ